MKLQKDMKITLTDEFVNWLIEFAPNNHMVDLNKGEELIITEVVDIGDSLDIYFMSAEIGEIDLDFVIGIVDQDRFCRDNSIKVFEIVSNSSASYHDDDKCKKCGRFGQLVRTACICQNCGEVVWGF